jgi:hypothetical protein
MPPVGKRKPQQHDEFLPPEGSDVESFFRELGFDRVPKPPYERPLIPEDFAVCNDTEISRYQTAYILWKEYAEDMQITVTANLMRIEEEYDVEYTKIKLSLSGKPTEIKDRASVDPRVLEYRKKVTELNIYSTMLASKIESYASCLAVISREIAARKRN